MPVELASTSGTLRIDEADLRAIAEVAAVDVDVVLNAGLKTGDFTRDKIGKMLRDLGARPATAFLEKADGLRELFPPLSSRTLGSLEDFKSELLRILPSAEDVVGDESETLDVLEIELGRLAFDPGALRSAIQDAREVHFVGPSDLALIDRSLWSGTVVPEQLNLSIKFLREVRERLDRMGDKAREDRAKLTTLLELLQKVRDQVLPGLARIWDLLAKVANDAETMGRVAATSRDYLERRLRRTSFESAIELTIRAASANEVPIFLGHRAGLKLKTRKGEWIKTTQTEWFLDFAGETCSPDRRICAVRYRTSTTPDMRGVLGRTALQRVATLHLRAYANGVLVEQTIPGDFVRFSMRGETQEAYAPHDELQP